MQSVCTSGAHTPEPGGRHETNAQAKWWEELWTGLGTQGNTRGKRLGHLLFHKVIWKVLWLRTLKELWEWVLIIDRESVAGRGAAPNLEYAWHVWGTTRILVTPEPGSRGEHGGRWGLRACVEWDVADHREQGDGSQSQLLVILTLGAMNNMSGPNSRIYFNWSGWKPGQVFIKHLQDGFGV